MSLALRTIEKWAGNRIITTPAGRLLVEEREYFTSYRLRTWRRREIWIDVRNCEPLHRNPPQIIYARTIPWFMWIWYALRDIPRKWRERYDFQQWAENEKKKREALVAYQRRYLEQSFFSKSKYGGRYNR